MDKRLEEQLERVRQLSERVAQIHEQLAQNTELMARDRVQASASPLHRVRDLRQHSSQLPERERSTVNDRSARRRRSRRR